MSLTTQTTSAGSAKPSTPQLGAVEARTPGREVEPSHTAPSRPGVHPLDRVTSSAPFTIERTITSDDIHLVTVTLTDDATHAHVRDLYSHRALLIAYFEMRQQAADRRVHPSEAADARRLATQLEDRLAAALTSHATTQWELTHPQAEDLLTGLEDATAEPETCAVGTCTGYAATDGYCAGHAEGI